VSSLPVLLLGAPLFAQDRSAPVDYSREIRPILEATCVSCHGPKKHKGDFRLDTLERALAGSPEGKVIVPGDAAASDLYRRLVTPDVTERMPQKAAPLSAKEIETIRRWIDEGAGTAKPAPAQPSAESGGIDRDLAALPRGCAAVAYVLDAVPGVSGGESSSAKNAASSKYVARVRKKDGTLTRIEIGDVPALESAVDRWRAAIGVPSSGESAHAPKVSTEEAGQTLRALVLDPILSAAGEAGTLYACLDGPLHRVALDALPLGDGYVGDRVRILDQDSLRALRDWSPMPPASPSAPSLLAVGFAALPRAQDEIDGIAKLFRDRFGADASKLTGPRATWDAPRDQAASARFLHVATRGWFRPDSQDPGSACGIALAGASNGASSDGRIEGSLTAAELAKLDLSRCELAVLSADVGRAGLFRPGQGVASLQSALHQAGARATLACLWAADDAWTSTLMVEFYRRLWTLKEPMAEALSHAKSFVRSKGAPMRAWAGWMLTGARE
jgi:CHAT domain-containing protein/mono/diheme cytochrome c family protein